MYTEEYEKRSFSLTNFLLKILLIAVIILLLILFLPKYLSPIFKNNSKIALTPSTKGVAFAVYVK